MANPIPTWPRDRFPVDLNRTQWSMPESFLNGLTALPGYLEVPQLVGDQNNLDPGDFPDRNFISLSSSTDINITGLVSSQQGEMKFLLNRGPNNITLVNESGLSDEPNRFAGAQSLTLAPNEGMIIIQDAVSSRWRFMSNGVFSVEGRIPYPTLTNALANVPAGATFFITGAYAETGDGGQATYTAIATPGAPADGQYQAATGEWFEIADPILRPQQFGASGKATSEVGGKTIKAITKAATGVVEITNHGYAAGTVLYFHDCLGMLDVNLRWFVVGNPTTDFFEMHDFAGVGINTSSYGNYTANSGTATTAYNDTAAMVRCKNASQRLQRAQFWEGHFLLNPGSWVWQVDVSDGEHKPGPTIFTDTDCTIFPTNSDPTTKLPVLSVRKNDVNNFRFVQGGSIGPLRFIDKNTYTYETFNLIGVTKAAIAVATVSVASHTFQEGDIVYIKECGGMNEINQQFYIVTTPITASTFALNYMSDRPVDSDGFGTYTTGGTVTRVPWRSALNLSGVQDMAIGKLYGLNLKGNLLQFENRHTANFSSDEYHVATCAFEGLTATQHTITMVPTYCLFNNVIDQGASSNVINHMFGTAVSAWSGAGAANTVVNVASGAFGPGWSISFTPIGQTFRCYIDSAEADNCEFGMRVHEIAGLYTRALRMNIRPGGTAARPHIPAGMSWPRTCISLGFSANTILSPSTVSDISNSQIGCHFRIQVPVNLLPYLLDLNNDPQINNCVINLTSGVDAGLFQIDTIANNGSGLFRLTGKAGRADGRDFATGMVMQVKDVTGGAAAILNNNWYTITVVEPGSIDPPVLSVIDLQNTSAGAVVGSGGGLTSVYSIQAPVPSGMIVSNVTNNGAGLMRLTVNSTANLVEGQLIRIVNNTPADLGVPNIIGCWQITIVNSTTFDLIGSAFAGAYVGGLGGAGIVHPWITGLNSGQTIRITMDGRTVYDTLRENSVVSVGFRLPITLVEEDPGAGTEIWLTVVSTLQMATGMRVTVEGLTGSPLGNAEWVITVQSATKFSLNGSTFVASGQAAGAFVANFVNVAAQYLLEPSRMYYAGELVDSNSIYFPTTGQLRVPYSSVTRITASLTIPAYFGMQVRMALVRNRLGTFVPLAESNQRGVGDGSAVRTIANPAGITATNPAVVTTTANHNIASGTIVYITGVTGMTQVNGRFWIAAGAAGTTFNLQSLAGVNFDATALAAGADGFVAVCMDQTFSITGSFGGIELQMSDMIWLSAVSNAAEPIPIRNSSPYSGASGGSADKTNRITYLVSQQ